MLMRQGLCYLTPRRMRGSIKSPPPELQWVKTMKILMVINYYSPHVSGLTIYVERISQELVRRGHRVTVLASRHRADLPLHETLAGVSVVRLPVVARINKGVVTPTFAWDAPRLVRQHDVVHMHLPMLESSYVAWLARRLTGRGAILTYHCDLLLPKSPLASTITRVLSTSHHLAARQSDVLVTYTQDYARNSRFLRRYMRKVATVYPPIVIAPPDNEAAARWRTQLGLDGCKIVGFAGRFSEDKGGNYLLASIPEVASAVPDVRYVFAGEHRKVVGEDFYGKVRHLVEQHEDRVQFLGELHGQQLSSFYSMCDVLTLPSVNSTESFGMVQVEAMLCGTPVVASDIPGVREATRVTGMGLVVPPRDHHALAGGLTEVLLNPQKYDSPRIDLASSFSVGQTVDFYEELYERGEAYRQDGPRP
jgi:glycosyltransferase involved in cell wall biosynthesis